MGDFANIPLPRVVTMGSLPDLVLSCLGWRARVPLVSSAKAVVAVVAATAAKVAKNFIVKV